MPTIPALRITLFTFIAIANFEALLHAEELQKCDKLTKWTPASVTGFVHVHNVGPRLRSFLGSANLKRILDSDMGKTYLRSDGHRELVKNLSAIEESTGRKPLDLFDDLFGKETLLASRLSIVAGQEWLLLARGKTKASLAEGREAFDNAIEANTGFPTETVKAGHEGHIIEQIDETWLTFLGEIFAVSNSEKMIEEVVDLAYGRTEKSANKHPVYSKLPADDKSLARVALKPNFIPGLAGAWVGKQDDPVVSLLLGGVMGALRGCELATISLDSNWSGIKLNLALHPGDRGISEKYSPFFPRISSSEFEANIRERGTLGMITLSRNFDQWLKSSREFLSARASASLAQISAVISVFMGGLDFKDDVLPQAGKTVSLVFQDHEPPAGEPSPTPVLPGGALVFELADADKNGQPLISGFKSLVGIINLTRMQQDPKLPRMKLEPKEVAGITCYKVAMVPPADLANPGIEYNFTPTVAISNNRIILGSTFDLVKTLVEVSENSKPSSPAGSGPYATDQFSIDGTSLRSALEKNLGFLATQQATEKGIGLEAAKAELEAILELLSYTRKFEFKTYRHNDTVHMEIDLGLNFDRTIVGEREGDGK